MASLLITFKLLHGSVSSIVIHGCNALGHRHACVLLCRYLLTRTCLFSSVYRSKAIFSRACIAIAQTFHTITSAMFFSDAHLFTTNFEMHAPTKFSSSEFIAKQNYRDKLYSESNAVQFNYYFCNRKCAASVTRRDTKSKLHSNSVSTPSEFAIFLQSAKKIKRLPNTFVAHSILAFDFIFARFSSENILQNISWCLGSS